ncbi:hypothetical protein ACFL4F_03510 [Candidatus Margulisiibacteriota bacterium]
MKKFTVFLLTLTVFVGIVSSSYSATFQGLKKTAKAKQEKFLKSIKDLYLDQIVTFQSERASRMKYFIKGDAYRMDSILGAMTLTRIIKGNVRFDIGILGVQEGPATQEDKDTIKTLVMINRSFGAMDGIDKAKYVGKEKVGGRKCNIYEGSVKKDIAKGGTIKAKIWVDPKTATVIKAKNTSTSKDGKSGSITWIYSDFKKVKGFEIPYKTKIYMYQPIPHIYSVNSLKVDKGIANSEFDADKVMAAEKKRREQAEKGGADESTYVEKALKKRSDEGMNYVLTKNKAQGDLRVLKVCIESIKKNKGSFPSTNNYQAILLKAKPQILDAKLYDPFVENKKKEYEYKVSSNGGYFVIYSVGPSGKGGASVSNAGIIKVSDKSVIWESNGHL